MVLDLVQSATKDEARGQRISYNVLKYYHLCHLYVTHFTASEQRRPNWISHPSDESSYSLMVTMLIGEQSMESTIPLFSLSSRGPAEPRGSPYEHCVSRMTAHRLRTMPLMRDS